MLQDECIELDLDIWEVDSFCFHSLFMPFGSKMIDFTFRRMEHNWSCKVGNFHLPLSGLDAVSRDSSS